MTSQDTNDTSLLADVAAMHAAQHELVSMARDALESIASDPLGEDVETGHRLVAVGEQLRGAASRRGRAARDRVVSALAEGAAAS